MFYDLHQVNVDDEIVVARQDGSVAVFRVARSEQYPKIEFPTDEVYGDIDHAGLRLITCGGFNEQSQGYDDNIVIYAELVPPSTG